MSTHDGTGRAPRFELELRAFLDAEAAADHPDYLHDVLVRSVVSRQRRAWTFPSRWIPMATFTGRLAVLPSVRWRTLGLIALIALLVLLAAGVAIVASRPRVPAPFGPARNGLIAYAWEGDLYVSDDGLTASRPLVAGPEQDGTPLFSLDGTRIAFVRKVGRQPMMFVASADGSHQTQVSTYPMSSVDLHELGWSPDGRFLAFETDRGGMHAVVVAAADGSGSTVVTPDGVHTDSVSWRPGTATLLYRAQDPVTGAFGLRLMHADGTGDRPITPVDGHAEDYQYAVWSPDGAWIAFTHSDGSSLPQQLHVIDPTGAVDIRLHGDGTAMWPDWSPGGGGLSYYLPDGGGWLVAVATFDPVARTLTPGRPLGPGHAGFTTIWSPDGRSILEGDVNDNMVTVIDVETGAVRSASWKSSSFASWQRLAP